jgi:hypothetical protein
MPGPPDFDEFNPNNPYTALALLAERVKNLGKEKEDLERDLDQERAEREDHERDLEKRIAAMEKSFQRGAGALIVLPVVGTVIGLLFAYGKVIFAPWLNNPR